jgi:hypothetical protein
MKKVASLRGGWMGILALVLIATSLLAQYVA